MRFVVGFIFCLICIRAGAQQQHEYLYYDNHENPSQQFNLSILEDACVQSRLQFNVCGAYVEFKSSAEKYAIRQFKEVPYHDQLGVVVFFLIDPKVEFGLFYGKVRIDRQSVRYRFEF